MEQIKFRAYDIFTKKMWKWEEHNAFSTNKGSIKDWFTDQDLRIMQYTGRRDWAGKEIYEGDILGLINTHIFGVVDYSKQFAGFVLYPTKELNNIDMEPLDEEWEEDADRPRYLVVGNIYKNPELL